MAFGVKAKDDTAASNSNSGSNNWIKYFRDGETTVHFLEELGEWTRYYEHYSQTKKRYYPCTGNRDNCPGCTSADEREQKASKRYLVNCLHEGYVDLYKMPAMLWEDLNRFADKDGTIMARDYTIVRYENTANGLPTYSLDREDKVAVDVKAYAKQMTDHQAALLSAWNEAWDDNLKVEDLAETPENQERKPAKKAVKSRQATLQDLHDQVQKTVDDDPPSEPAQEEIEPEQDEIEITEDQLRSMGLDQILALYSTCGLQVPDKDDENDDEYLLSLQQNLITLLG